MDRDDQTGLQRRIHSTNGHGIYRVDMVTSEEGDVDGYLTPDELWAICFGASEAQEAYWRNRFGAVPFEDKGGHWQPRYYQHNAIQAMLTQVAKGHDRILLTLATGTGKTAIAFQIAWKSFHSRWNINDWRTGIEVGQEPSRGPRILFLADRNILADQAYNAFGLTVNFWSMEMRVKPPVYRHPKGVRNGIEGQKDAGARNTRGAKDRRSGNASS
jgi:type I restriction enzyme R subunit